MITVHHLNNSRSQRILWLLEELAAPYEIVKYQRDAETNLAPSALKEVHLLGKSPVIVDGDLTLAESGAAVDYLAMRHGDGRLRPREDEPAYPRYLEWLHYAEGSAMLPVMLLLYTSRLGEGAAPLMPRIDGEFANHFGYMNGALEGSAHFAGPDFTAADIQLTFVLEAAKSFGRLAPYPNLAAFVDRMHARPAYRRAIEKGGLYTIGQ